MVGQGAGDALANPPRGIRSKFEAHAVLVFVDRPHQTAIAFLDQIAERQSPAPIALGNRHHQAQIALGQFAARFLIDGPAAVQDSGQGSQFLRRALRFEHEIAKLLDQLTFPLPIGSRSTAGIDLSAQVGHLGRPGLDLLGPEFEQLGAWRQFARQMDRLTHPPVKLATQAGAHAHSAGPQQHARIGLRGFKNMAQRSQVARNARQDALPAQTQAGDHINRRIQRQLSGFDSFESFRHSTQHIPIRQGGMPIARASCLQPLSQLQLLLPVEEWNGAHLFQI